MLYVAPERLRSLEFVLALRRAGVGLFVVDEALYLGVGATTSARITCSCLVR